MIVYHGSRYKFDTPDIAAMGENTLERSFPLGLWVSANRQVAELFGPFVYRMEIDAIPMLLRTEQLLSRPRHIHVHAGRDVLILPNRFMVVINLDVIRNFRYTADDSRQIVPQRRNVSCM